MGLAGGLNLYTYPLNPVTKVDPLGLVAIPMPPPVPGMPNSAQQELNNNAAKSLTKWLSKNFNNSEEEKCPPCTPPAGEKYNINVYLERHEDRGLLDGAHGCMVLTGSPKHWHYDVNNQNPKTCQCYPQKHVFGGCGLP